MISDQSYIAWALNLLTIGPIYQVQYNTFIQPDTKFNSNKIKYGSKININFRRERKLNSQHVKNNKITTNFCQGFWQNICFTQHHNNVNEKVICQVGPNILSVNPKTSRRGGLSKFATPPWVKSSELIGSLSQLELLKSLINYLVSVSS